jgi:hypothetical protein
MNKYTFAFKEINYGSITIVASSQPDESEVREAVENGGAFFNDTEYEDICLTEVSMK